EPKSSPKPQPIGNAPFIFLFTTCTLCAVFLLWRRASSLKRVIQHRLETWKETQEEGHIRLSEDDGPSAASFLADDYDDHHQGLQDSDIHGARPAPQPPASAEAPGGEPVVVSDEVAASDLWHAANNAEAER
ncbi:hypothetical protein PUNSTDRAFT_107513, partial [Punctularia strigosozonata HHB-11173 SS5]